jgi:hypothetical protein
MQATVTTPTARYKEVVPYADFLRSFRSNFEASVAGQKALFTTDAQDLFATFLEALPEHERQHYTCHACRRFVETYGGLVTISEDGEMSPVMWNDAPFYVKVMKEVRKKVLRARVNGVFLSKEHVWGQPVTGEWAHMSVMAPKCCAYYGGAIKTAGQAMAEKREEYGMLQRGLAAFDESVVEQALNLLEGDALYRNERCLGPAKWLVDLHQARSETNSKKAKENVTWLAVATAPAGYCHVRTTMIGTLLEDIANGLQPERIKRRFADKMNPLQYQRPQVAPSAGNIKQAEEIVSKLQSAGALARRYARLEEVKALWTPKPSKEPKSEEGGSVFGHLRPRGRTEVDPVEVPAVKMTWAKFCDTVLPEAETIEALTPWLGSFIALVTAVDPNAAPILQWDSLECRNPVNWYVYPGKSPSHRWNLSDGIYVPVNAVTLLPPMWNEEQNHGHQGAGAILILDGCRDMRPEGGLALFPEVLKSEYRAVRRTIEAFSRGAEIEGGPEATACGIDLRKGATWDQRVRVVSKGGKKVAHYILDRWD